MSFASREDIISLVQDLLVHCWPGTLVTPFQQMFYDDAMTLYGVDKPDLRYSNKIINLTKQFGKSGFDFIDNRADDEAFLVGGIFFEADSPNCLKSVEKEVKLIMADHIKDCKERNLPLIISSAHKKNGNVENSLLKKCSAATLEKVAQQVPETTAGFLVAGAREAALPVLGRLRTQLARELVPDLDTREDKFLWVVDFPLFVMEEGRLESAHHPFTAAHPDDYHMFR